MNDLVKRQRMGTGKKERALKGYTTLFLLNMVRCGKTTNMLLKGKNITK